MASEPPPARRHLPVVEPTWNLDPRSKYETRVRELDCDARLHLCKGVCCTLELPLQKSDVDEGVVAWDPDRPYLVRMGADRRCVHQTAALGCGVFDQRPRICRLYTCEADGRIWRDFARRIPNEEVIAHLLDPRED